ncbi:MAG: hypothetical protein WKF37_08150 [Bryobacteraceae bacterium]
MDDQISRLQLDATGVRDVYGLVYLLLRREPIDFRSAKFLVILILTAGIGVLYPLLFPTVLILLSVKVLILWFARPSGRSEAMQLALAMACSVGLAAAHYSFITADRVLPAPITFHSPAGIVRRFVEVGIVVSPLLLGLAIVSRRLARTHGQDLILLILGALGSGLLAALFNIRYFMNEYKFVFASIICLAPFASLAAERIVQTRRKTVALPALALIVVALAVAFQVRMSRWPWDKGSPQPVVDASTFYLRLQNGESYGGISHALRTLTPPETVVAIDNVERHYPMLTSRSLFATAANKLHVGVNLQGDELLSEIRGYGMKLLTERRLVLQALFHGSGDRGMALSKIRELARPVAVVVEPRHQELANWLKSQSGGQVIYEDKDAAVWLLSSR